MYLIRPCQFYVASSWWCVGASRWCGGSDTMCGGDTSWLCQWSGGGLKRRSGGESHERLIKKRGSHETGRDRLSCGPKNSKNIWDRGLDRGPRSFPVHYFRSWPVQVQSSPGFFPVLGLDLQTLLILKHSNFWHSGLSWIDSVASNFFKHSNLG